MKKYQGNPDSKSVKIALAHFFLLFLRVASLQSTQIGLP